jgi:hypothetical protein
MPRCRLNLPRVRTSLPSGRLHMFEGKLHVPLGKLHMPHVRLHMPLGKLHLHQSTLDLHWGIFVLHRGRLKMPLVRFDSALGGFDPERRRSQDALRRVQTQALSLFPRLVSQRRQACLAHPLPAAYRVRLAYSRCQGLCTDSPGGGARQAASGEKWTVETATAPLAILLS